MKKTKQEGGRELETWARTLEPGGLGPNPGSLEEEHVTLVKSLNRSQPHL